MDEEQAPRSDMRYGESNPRLYYDDRAQHLRGTISLDGYSHERFSERGSRWTPVVKEGAKLKIREVAVFSSVVNAATASFES